MVSCIHHFLSTCHTVNLFDCSRVFFTAADTHSFFRSIFYVSDHLCQLVFSYKRLTRYAYNKILLFSTLNSLNSLLIHPLPHHGTKTLNQTSNKLTSERDQTYQTGNPFRSRVLICDGEVRPGQSGSQYT